MAARYPVFGMEHDLLPYYECESSEGSRDTGGDAQESSKSHVLAHFFFL